MTQDEQKALVEFIGERFDRNDRRFDGIEARLDGIDGRLDGMDGRLTRIEVLHEDTRHQVQILAEGFASRRVEVDRRFDALEERMDSGFREMRELLQASHGSLDRRLTRLEERLTP